VGLFAQRQALIRFLGTASRFVDVAAAAARPLRCAAVMRTRLLVTGFEPFGGHSVNPSERLARIAAECAPTGVVVSTRVLPVAYRRAFAPVAEALESERIDVALLLGLGAGRATVDFERFAVNWRGGAHPDNDGVRVAGEAIDPGGPAAYFATLPIDDCVAAARAAGAPCGVSSHAGTFICNQLFYQVLRHCDRQDLKCRVGFLHVPLLPEQASAGEPAASEESMAAGLRAVIEELARDES
jgi:pyroglutamyl-peptidase